MIFTLLGIGFLIAGLVSWLIVTLDAFRDAIWKGLLCIFGCGIFWLYYALFEFDHDNKWGIVLLGIGGTGIAGAFFQLAK